MLKNWNKVKFLHELIDVDNVKTAEKVLDAIFCEIDDKVTSRENVLLGGIAFMVNVREALKETCIQYKDGSRKFYAALSKSGISSSLDRSLIREVSHVCTIWNDRGWGSKEELLIMIRDRSGGLFGND